MAKKTTTKPAKSTAATKKPAGTKKSAALSFHPVPLPQVDRLPALLRDQIGPLLDQALDDGPDGLSLLTCFEVREGSEHRYDLTLFCDDDGAVYRKGTLEQVASFSQGGATGSTDAALLAALNAAHGAWAKQKKPRPAAPPTEPPPSGAPTTLAVPRYATLFAPDQYELGKKLNAKAKTGLLRITKAPTPADLAALDGFLPSRAAGFVVEIGPSVPLSLLAHLSGVPFVVLAAGRKDWAGLVHLPKSVRRLSIRKASEPALGELPKDNQLVSVDIEAPRVAKGSPALAHLETLAWTGAEDAAWASLHPKLRELALRKAKIGALPASPTVERLLLFKPSGLSSLVGIDAMPKLAYLRIDDAGGMKRLGDLRGATSLATIHLTAAHRIGDLSDLRMAPKLERLGVVQSQLDGTPFEGLKGKLKSGSFQLKSMAYGQALLAHLGVPSSKTHELEQHLFDVR